jgi:hypothetical protein
VLTFDVWRPAPIACTSSGRFARTSQKSDVVCPVLVPPWNVTPPWRAFTVTSRPLKTCDVSPYFDESVTVLRIWPARLGTTSKRPDTV